jgi:hypothetical protein
MGRRTTITLDDDVARKLAEESRKTGEPFKVVVNEAIRRGMLKRDKATKPFQVTGARDLKPLPGVNLDKISELLYEEDLALFREKVERESRQSEELVAAAPRQRR